MTTSDRATCPYCNAAVPGPGWTVCPRCGELAPGSANGVPGRHHVPAAPPPDGDTGVVRSLAPVALIGGLLAALLLAGFVVYFTRGPARPPVTKPALAPPSATVPPPGVPGLGRLPPDAAIVAAVQPGRVVTYAESTKTDPGDLLRDLGVPAAVFDPMTRAGIALPQVRAITAGIVLADDDAIPRVVVVLTLLAPPADPDKLREAAATGRFPLEMAEADPQTFLFASRKADLTAALGRTAAGPGQLPAAVKARLADLSPASFAWVVTDDIDWARKPSITLAAQLAKRSELPDQLASIRSAAVGASFEPDPQLSATALARDAATADRIRAVVADRPGVILRGQGEKVTADLPFDLKDGLPDWREWLPKPGK